MNSKILDISREAYRMASEIQKPTYNEHTGNNYKASGSTSILHQKPPKGVSLSTADKRDI